MSSGDKSHHPDDVVLHVRRRPNLWSYFSFSPTTSRRPSVSSRNRAPTLDDPHEKPNRHLNGLPTGGGGGSGSHSSTNPSMWMAQGHQRSRIVKVVVAIVCMVSLIFFLSPRSGRVSRYVGQHRSNTGQTISDPAIGSTKCTRSSDASKPLIQYALMIDAGSTGSRIHVYRFNNCGPTPELEDEVFHMTEKKPGGSGLSSYKSDAEGAAKSLDVLMDIAVKNVPKSLQSCSPVAVKATAGLRILGPELSNQILEAVRHRLETAYPFPVISKEKGGVEIMDGKDEGVYAWITTNYLLGKIGGPNHTPTAAVFDLGGGSTQIVFEPTFKGPAGGMPNKMAEGDHKYELTFGGRKFSLYQHSHLGYGLMAAREAVHKAVVEAQRLEHQRGSKEHHDDPSWFTKEMINPCLAPGTSRSVKIKLDKGHPLGESVTVNMTGPVDASPAQCRGLAEKILHKDAACNLAPCSFGGVHQPSLEQTFAKEDVYTFSYFYDRTQPLGMPESFTLRELKDVTAQVCGGEEHWGAFAAVDGALNQLRDRPEWCLDLSFMLALLHTGYEMPLEREVKIAKTIKGNELGWCLGASLPLLNRDSGWQCRIKDITNE
ncbi:MAG: Guanosine-diphosphatase [Watsoniomyces obsoletus]|nr:MAG: Guanosine-diphosphatase [Watsoniomyces obsoletus]